MRDRIEINKNLIPYRFDIVLAGRAYTFFVDYNRTACFFTVSLYDSAGSLLCSGEPLVYGMPLFRAYLSMLCMIPPLTVTASS